MTVFAHFNFNVLDLKKSLTRTNTTNFTRIMKRWDVSATKIRQWVFISSQTLTAIGLKLCRKNRIFRKISKKRIDVNPQSCYDM